MGNTLYSVSMMCHNRKWKEYMGLEAILQKHNINATGIVHLPFLNKYILPNMY